MTDEDIKQRVSLLVDDQLGTAEGLKLLAGMHTNRELASTYSHYLLIGEAIRSNGALLADPRLANRIHSAIQTEPAIIVPAWKSRTTRERIVTAALAATLTAVAVLVGRAVVREPSLVGPAMEQLAQISGGSSLSSNGEGGWHNYLVNHNETAYLAANGSLFPQARLVSSGKPGH